MALMNVATRTAGLRIGRVCAEEQSLAKDVD